MQVTTKAIVLSSIKYGDNSLIVKCITEEAGCKTYMLHGVLSSKRGKVRKSFFQPLSQLKINAKHNLKGNLNSIKEVETHYSYKSLYSNIYKQSIAIFLSEMLSSSLQEEEENRAIYQYLEVSLTWLDLHEEFSNFHLLFLLNLTKYLGFYPDAVNSNYEYFDLEEGSFVKNEDFRKTLIKGEVLKDFKKLLGTKFDTLNSIKINAKRRQEILEVLIQYFKFHLTGFKNPKSLEVLKAVFE